MKKKIDILLYLACILATSLVAGQGFEIRFFDGSTVESAYYNPQTDNYAFWHSFGVATDTGIPKGMDVRVNVGLPPRKNVRPVHGMSFYSVTGMTMEEVYDYLDNYGKQNNASQTQQNSMDNFAQAAHEEVVDMYAAIGDYREADRLGQDFNNQHGGGNRFHNSPYSDNAFSALRNKLTSTDIPEECYSCKSSDFYKEYIKDGLIFTDQYNALKGDRNNFSWLLSQPDSDDTRFMLNEVAKKIKRIAQISKKFERYGQDMSKMTPEERKLMNSFAYAAEEAYGKMRFRKIDPEVHPQLKPGLANEQQGYYTQDGKYYVKRSGADGRASVPKGYRIDQITGNKDGTITYTFVREEKPAGPDRPAATSKESPIQRTVSKSEASSPANSTAAAQETRHNQVLDKAVAEFQRELATTYFYPSPIIHGCRGNCISVDETEKTWYRDKDTDGYYGERKTTATRPPGEGWSLSQGEGEDCDDANPKVHESKKDLGSFQIYKDERQPGKESPKDGGGIARDYMKGDLTQGELNDLIDEHIKSSNGPKGSKRGNVNAAMLRRRVAQMMELTDTELFEKMEDAAWYSLHYQQYIGSGLGDFSFDLSYRSNLTMINRFKENSKGIFEGSDLSKDMLTSDSNFKKFVADLMSNVEEKIQSIENIDEIMNISLSKVSPPRFNTGGNFFNWNSSWSINIDFKNVKLDCNKLEGTLEINVFDQFGLDNGDLGLDDSKNSASNNARALDGIWAWFILQRVSRPNRENYAPFINKLSADQKIEITIKK